MVSALKQGQSCACLLELPWLNSHMLRAWTDLVSFLAIMLHCSGLPINPRTIPNASHRQHLSAAAPVASFFRILLSQLSVPCTVRKGSLSSNHPKPTCPRLTSGLVAEQELTQHCRGRLNDLVGWRVSAQHQHWPLLIILLLARAAKKGLKG